MKKSIIRYIEIFLTFIILVGLFMPYAENNMPLDYIFPNSIRHLDLFIVTIPIIVTIPFLLTLIFKAWLRNSLLRILKVIFVVLYVIIVGYYIFILIDTFLFGYSFGDNFVAASAAIFLSLNLLLFSLKYVTLKSDELQNIILAIMTLPFIFCLLVIPIFWDIYFNYGGYIINISFISLYIIALIDIFRNYNTEKLIKKDKPIAS